MHMPTWNRNPPIKVNSFVRFEKGEGIEKKQDDFAAEVAAAAGLK